MHTELKSRKFMILLFRVLKIKPLNVFLPLIFFIVKPLLSDKARNTWALLPVNKTVKIELPKSCSFYMKNDGSDGIANKIYWKGVSGYEPETLFLVLHLLKNVRSFIDIGANTGIFSLTAACSDKNIQVHAFEPDRRAFQFLKMNAEINKFDNLRVNELAVSNFDGDSFFQLTRVHHPVIPLESRLRTEDSRHAEADIITIQTVKLDTYVKRTHTEKVDLLKIDTEGTEDKVIEGAAEILKTHRPLVICEVLMGGDIEMSLEKLFCDTDYKFFVIKKNCLQGSENITCGSPEIRNYLFIPEVKIQKYISGIRIT